MTATDLRTAAANLRALAGAATPGRRGWDTWVDGRATTHDEAARDIGVYSGANVPPPMVPDDGLLMDGDLTDVQTAQWADQRAAAAKGDAKLDAALGPTFALAVADLLDKEAEGIESGNWRPCVGSALAVAAALPPPVPAPLGDPETPTP